MNRRYDLFLALVCGSAVAVAVLVNFMPKFKFEDELFRFQRNGKLYLCREHKDTIQCKILSEVNE